MTPELASGQIDRWSREAYDPLLRHAAHPLGLDALDAAVDEALERHARHDPGLDATLAPALHRALPLSRREAADDGVWRYLTVIHRPDLVRHRWENRSWATMRTRFWRPGTRPDSNAIARLWWIAELTREGEDYSLTTAVLARQPLATALFVRDLAHYRPFTVAFVNAVEALAGPEIEATMSAVNRRLSTTAVEALSEGELRAMITEAERP